MPRIVAELPKTHRGRARKYDYAELYKKLEQSGQAAELVQGEDFHCTGASMRQFLYRDAAEKGFKVKVRNREEEDGREIVTFAITKNGAKAEKPKQEGEKK